MNDFTKLQIEDPEKPFHEPDQPNLPDIPNPTPNPFPNPASNPNPSPEPEPFPTPLEPVPDYPPDVVW